MHLQFPILSTKVDVYELFCQHYQYTCLHISYVLLSIYLFAEDSAVQ